MELSAARIAILPRRNPTFGSAGEAAARPRDGRGASGCTVYSFQRDGDACRRRAGKRIAILDPFEIEQRLLVALAEAERHRVTVHRDAEHFLASLGDVLPEIAFVHMYFDGAMRRAAETGRRLPPIVLIDSCSITCQSQPQLAPFGDFTALRFPIGLHEFAEAIRRSAH